MLATPWREASLFQAYDAVRISAVDVGRLASAKRLVRGLLEDVPALFRT